MVCIDDYHFPVEMTPSSATPKGLGLVGLGSSPSHHPSSLPLSWHCPLCIIWDKTVRLSRCPRTFFGMRHHIAMPHFGTWCSVVALGCDMTTPLAPHALVAPYVLLSPLLIADLTCRWPLVCLEYVTLGPIISRNSMRGSERFWTWVIQVYTHMAPRGSRR